MPFNSLLFDSLCCDNKIEENNISVSINKKELDTANETLLLFQSDDDKHHFKKIWLKKYQTGQITNPKCCDAIAYYHNNTKRENQVTICFIELKGKELIKAVEQIQMTYQAVATQLEAEEIPLSKIQWKVVIVSSRSLPKNQYSILKPLFDKFSRENVKYEKTNNFNLTSFLQN